jgi:Holliday junction resolvase
MHRSWGKPDANQRAIIEALEAAGCAVLRLAALGQGAPDLLVYRSCRDAYWLVEIKAKGGTLTPAQIRFRARWSGPIDIVRSVDEALAMIGVTM